MKTLSESLLSDFDTIAKRSDASMYLGKTYDAWQNNSSNTLNKKCQDGLGRQLRINDIVIVGLSSGEVTFGKIVDINKKSQTYKCIAVSLKGDGSDVTILNGPNKGEISDENYYFSGDLIKIDEQILKMIYNLK